MLSLNVSINPPHTIEDSELLRELARAIEAYVSVTSTPEPNVAPELATEAPVKATPVKATPVKTTPVKTTPVKTTPVKAAPEPEPEPEPAEDDVLGSAPTLEQAVQRATELVSKGKSADVRAALNSVSPGTRVSELEGPQIAAFLAALA